MSVRVTRTCSMSHIQKTKKLPFGSFKLYIGADDGTRTHNNLLGRQELQPIELRPHKQSSGIVVRDALLSKFFFFYSYSSTSLSIFLILMIPVITMMLSPASAQSITTRILHCVSPTKSDATKNISATLIAMHSRERSHFVLSKAKRVMSMRSYP